MRFLICSTAGVAVACMAGVADARISRIWSYSDLTKEADIVAVVEFKETQLPTKATHPFGPKHKYAEEVTTDLKPLAILKGKEKDLDELRLVHFRMKKPPQPLRNGPNFASFKKKQRYLVFLKKFGNDRYEPVSGQMDPVDSIKLLSGS